MPTAGRRPEGAISAPAAFARTLPTRETLVVSPAARMHLLCAGCYGHQPANTVRIRCARHWLQRLWLRMKANQLCRRARNSPSVRLSGTLMMNDEPFLLLLHAAACKCKFTCNMAAFSSVRLFFGGMWTANLSLQSHDAACLPLGTRLKARCPPDMPPACTSPSNQGRHHFFEGRNTTQQKRCWTFQRAHGSWTITDHREQHQQKLFSTRALPPSRVAHMQSARPDIHQVQAWPNHEGTFLTLRSHSLAGPPRQGVCGGAPEGAGSGGQPSHKTPSHRTCREYGLWAARHFYEDPWLLRGRPLSPTPPLLAATRCRLNRALCSSWCLVSRAPRPQN